MSQSEIDDGDPAFPCSGKVGYVDGGGGETKYVPYSYHGMTLRDWFAGMALQAIVTQFHECDSLIVGAEKDAYDYADAMLTERSK